MKIGVPKEIKNNEFRVGLTPESVAEVVVHGHSVVVETGAGAGIGCSDALSFGRRRHRRHRRGGLPGARMIVKVKEPQPVERRMLGPDHVLFTYLHLAPDPEQTKDLLRERRRLHRL